MNVLFGSKKLGKICNDAKACLRAYGSRASVLQRRLSQLRGAPNLGVFDKPPLKSLTDFHPLNGDRKGQYAMSIGQPYRLILEPYDSGPTLADTTSVMVSEIVDYH